MRSRRSGILLAAVLAIVGGFLLSTWLATAEDRALEGEDLVEVLIVRQQVPAGTAAAALEPLVEREDVPVKVRSADAVTDLAQLGERVATVELFPGEQVTAARFSDPGAFRPRVSNVEVPEGLLQVTVSVGIRESLGGTVRPGDTVGLVIVVPDDVDQGEISKLVLHKLLVTNVQSNSIPEVSSDQTVGQIPGGGFLVTLAGTVSQVERLVHANRFEELWLVDEPIDAPEGPGATQTKEQVLQ